MELDASENFVRHQTEKQSQKQIQEKISKNQAAVREQSLNSTLISEASKNRKVDKDIHISTLHQTVSFLDVFSVEDQLIQIFTEQVRKRPHQLATCHSHPDIWRGIDACLRAASRCGRSTLRKC